MEDKQPAAGDLTAEAASDDVAEDNENSSTATESGTKPAGEAAVDTTDEIEADTDESETATEEGGRKRRKLLAGRWMAIVVVVAALLFVGSAAFAGATMQPYLADRAAAATKLKVARTAANAITTLWTYTPENMDGLADRASAYLGGDFEAQYRKFVDAIVAPNKQAQITNKTQVTGAAVESLDGPNAVVIVYTNTTSTSPLTKNIPALKYLSYRLFMKRANGRWLVTRMTTVTSLDLTPRT
ncbi:mammalian cell entry protein [Mycobacterium sp. Aquia_213]|uniref:mammalian cell entry protein n=1 Tax=Mycobacterium sp. Aquia_213 TaxID=2991728 RepID=UPI00226D6AC8|nr:mammalian cell entry protein [Mycobacterium sp. Aquia_213]WAC91325.1 mammalian cell entry protein [Mycobacterium sp. Aquia_213]